MAANSKETVPSGVLMHLSPLVSRLIAPNAGAFTYTGTCTYVVGQKTLIIIDPGPDNDDHFKALIEAIGIKSVSHILVTHTHRDHSPLARRLASVTGAPIWGCSPHVAARSLFAGEQNMLEGSADIHHAPARILKDGDEVVGDGFILETIATPGHTMNHIAFALREENTLFSGDHVMGWSTTIVAPPDGNMSAYMASLNKLKLRKDKLYYPGHGDVITRPNRLVRGIITHRRQRENSILVRLKAGDHHISDIVPKIYEQLSKALHGAAALSVFAHLEDLVARKLVTCAGEPTMHSAYHIL